MRALRKILGFLIIALVGIPILFSVIWVVGLTKASVSPEFISDLPREIIAEVPDLAEEIFRDAQNPSLIKDENTRAWLDAAAKAGVTPKGFLTETGLLDWLENELSGSLAEVGKVLRGERRPRTIVFDMRPLKDILLRDDMDQYFLRILESLPPCDEEKAELWLEAARWPRGLENLPACQPDLEAAKTILREQRREAVADIPNEVEVFEDVRIFPFDISRTITLLSYALFVIPALFIFLGALTAAHSTPNFLRWSGVSVFLGALPVLLISLFAKHISLWALKFAPFSCGEGWVEGGSSELRDLILDKVSWIPMRVVDQLFSPVIAVAGIVCVIGVVIFALSFMERSGGRRETRSMTRTQAAKVEDTEKAKQEEVKPEIPETPESEP